MIINELEYTQPDENGRMYPKDIAQKITSTINIEGQTYDVQFSEFKHPEALSTIEKHLRDWYRISTGNLIPPNLNLDFVKPAFPADKFKFVHQIDGTQDLVYKDKDGKITRFKNIVLQDITCEEIKFSFKADTWEDKYD
jgi:hypothetical protein